MPTNRWAVGTMYQPGGPNGIFTQPDGPGTAVFPTQRNGVPFVDYPIQGLTIQEFSPWWVLGCQHAIKSLKIIREFDYDTNQSCALVACEVCTYVQYAIEPFEEWLDPIQRAIIVG
jgi:hypothetical protein